MTGIFIQKENDESVQININDHAIKKLEYGDKIQNHILIDVSGNPLNISDSNEKFKFIDIAHISSNNDFSVNADFLTRFNDLQKNINKQNIMFIFIIEGVIFSNNKKKSLIKIQERFNLHFVNTSNIFVLNTYRLTYWNCGFTILLDSDNIVRFSNSGIPIEDIFSVIKNELNKKTIFKNEN